ncbi:MAG TPA: FxLYD domain-containing protein [Terriglobales bacterium]|nr:FxLYD domain-containing protein [Terriglobales bacterium]
MYARAALMLAMLSLTTPAWAHAQSYAIQGIERYFRLEWEAGQGRRGAVISGYVHNTYGHTADRVRLVVEAVDGAGQVTDATHAQVSGTIPPGARGYFEVPAPRGAASYRVRLLSFDPVGRGV